MNNVTHRLFVAMLVISACLCVFHYWYKNKATSIQVAQLTQLDPSCESPDLIIFSYDRPMQLYALLESIKKHIVGFESISIIYRSSSQDYDVGYDRIKNEFENVHFIRQKNGGESDFKPLLIQILYAGKSPYVFFGVDDIIVKNDVDLRVCVRALKNYGAYGFYLRLGTHLTKCYSLHKDQPLPVSMTSIGENMVLWTFKDGFCDWHYPHSVDMTIYAKKDIVDSCVKLDYSNPNTFEDRWSRCTSSVWDKKGLCFTDSVIVNIPINCVQSVFKNRNMNQWSIEQLQQMFNAGLKIDITPLASLRNESCHIDYSCTFVER